MRFYIVFDSIKGVYIIRRGRFEFLLREVSI